MSTLLAALAAHTTRLADRLQAAARRRLPHGDAGASTAELVVITAILVTVALAVGLLFRTKILAKINSINFG